MASASSEKVEFRMRYFDRYELEHLLIRAGFHRFSSYGDFDGSPFDDVATSFVIVRRSSG